MESVGFDHLIKQDADTSDTLALIVDTVNTYSKRGFERDCAARLCSPGTPRNSCLRNVFDYYCRNVKYVLDTPGTEKVYTPARTIAEGFGDCKKAATFISSVLSAAGIEPVLKHVYYSGNDNYTHIYVVVFNPDTNDYITLDPTNNGEFDSEVNYQSATLYFLNGKVMELHQMGNSNGSSIGMTDYVSTGCQTMMGDLDALSSSTMGGTTALTVPNSPALNHFLSNVPVDIQRGATLEFIRHNDYGMATALATVLAHKPEALNEVWAKVGGDITTLKKAIIEGAGKQPTGISGPQYIGDAATHSIIQARIGQLMVNDSFLFHLDHLKIGGANGVRANSADAAMETFNHAVQDLGGRTDGTWQDYYYPGLQAHVNDQTSPGLMRAPTAGSGGILSTIANVAASAVAFVPGIGPIASTVIKGALHTAGDAAVAADKANLSAGHVNFSNQPRDNTGTPTAGSFFSPVGFAFKTILMATYAFHFSPAINSLIVTVALIPLIYIGCKKVLQKWI